MFYVPQYASIAFLAKSYRLRFLTGQICIVILQCATSGAYELPKAAKECVRPGAIEIQIQNWSMPIYIHIQPRQLSRVDLYFNGTQATRSFAAFCGSYAPGYSKYFNLQQKKFFKKIQQQILCFWGHNF